MHLANLAELVALALRKLAAARADAESRREAVHALTTFTDAMLLAELANRARLADVALRMARALDEHFDEVSTGALGTWAAQFEGLADRLDPVMAAVTSAPPVLH